MTSVLYSSGVNYMGRNPMGNEVRAIDRRVHDLEAAFNGVKGSVDSFMEKQRAAAAVPATPSTPEPVVRGPSMEEFDAKIGELRGQLEAAQAILDVMKLRLDKAESAAAAATAAASQAKTLATAAAADAASASATAAAAAAALAPPAPSA